MKMILMIVSWVVTPSGSVGGYQRIRGTHCFHLQDLHWYGMICCIGSQTSEYEIMFVFAFLNIAALFGYSIEICIKGIPQKRVRFATHAAYACVEYETLILKTEWRGRQCANERKTVSGCTVEQNTVPSIYSPGEY